MINIDWDTVDKFLEAGAEGTHVSAYFGIHPNTLYERCTTEKGCDFSEYKAQKRSKGDLALLSVQFDAAVKDKDKAMMIWLGKQRLGQKDKQETDLNHSGETRLVFNRVPDVNHETK